ncbi:MAG: D-3-phosphoglycerate [Erysipelotrichaceae bacterium]|nr:MAG: D-3-phosphoglycerate [Erysipelotrichaceae bacterium]
MFKVKTLNEIAPEGLELLSNKYEITELEDADGILVRSANLLEKAFEPTLKAIARAGVGVNNIPTERCAKAGIVVFNTPGANANAVKEIVLAALLISSREIYESIEWTKSLLEKGKEIPRLVEAGKSKFGGPELKDKTIGVIGLGAVGVLVANAAQSLGMNVLGYDPYISVDSAWGLSRNIKRSLSYDEIFIASDYLTLHIPYVEETKNFINEKAIAKMKEGVRICNFARGELVDDQAMALALERGKVAKYVTDFPNEQVLQMKNVIAIPHLGASTPESEVNCAMMAVRELTDYLENGNIKNSVNYPDCDMGTCISNARLAIHHQNIPGMVSAITTILGEHKLNIATMQNMSKKGWAYTMVDVDGKLSEQIVDSLSKIEGVVKVRVIKGLVTS